MTQHSLSFESPDVEKDFPGLYCAEDRSFSEEEEHFPRKKDAGRKKDKKEKKDKGYKMFEEEDSEEELFSEDTKSPSKMKKHSKPSFKFTKKDKFFTKDKEKEEKKEQKKEEKKKEEKEKDSEKKKDKKQKKNKFGGSSKTLDDTEDDLKPVFGIPLATAVERSKSHDGIQLPIIVRECVDYIEEHGLTCEGIYRISGVKSKVQLLKDAYNRNLPVNLSEQEPNIVASLLKQFLRELPEPVLTQELMPKFEQASTIKNVKPKVEQFQRLLQELPEANYLLLSWTIIHMTHVIAKEAQNKMSLQNVSIVLSPTMQISHRVLHVFFTYSKILFRDTVIKKYQPPLQHVTSSRWSLELPESPYSLQEELNKQESLLNQLHQELMQVKNKEKEEQLWEVQRIVTQLKRKLKHAKKAQEVAGSADSNKEEEKTQKAVNKPGTIITQMNKAQELEQKDQEREPEIQKDQTDINQKETVAQTEAPSVEEDSKQKPEVKEESKEVLTDTISPQTEDLPDSRSENKDESLDVVIPTSSSTPEMMEENAPETAPEQKESGQPGLQVRFQIDEEEVRVEEADIEDEESPEEQQEDDSERTVVSSIPREEDESAEKIVEDFSQMNIEDRKAFGEEEEEDEELQQLLRGQAALMLEEEELLAIGDELRQKIETERNEIERLEQEIAELQAIRDDLYEEEEEDSSASSSEESEDEEELNDVLEQLISDNMQLQKDNEELCKKIHEERQICLQVKVDIRLIQQRQQELAAANDLAFEKQLMLFE